MATAGDMNATARAILNIAKENSSAAYLLAENKKYNAAINRRYYSAFQVVYQKMLRLGKATLERGEDANNKHTKVLNFLRDNKVTDQCALLSQLKGYREKVDYKGIHVTKEEYECWATHFESLYRTLIDLYDDIPRGEK